MFQRFKKVFYKKFGFESVVNTQIDLYLKFKKKYNNVTEDEILNMLLLSRMKSSSILPQFSLKEQEKFYADLLQDNNKTLEEVISRIIWYEYVGSRMEQVIKKFSFKEVTHFQVRVDSYINEQVEKRIKLKN